MTRFLVALLSAIAMAMALTACGEDAAPAATTAPTPTPAAATAPTAAPASPTATLAPVVAATTAPEPTPVPTIAGPAQTQAPAPTEAPAPMPTAPAMTSEEPMLAEYAASVANGPGAIFVGDPRQLIGPPPHEGLMFRFPEDAYTQVATLGLFGSPELGAPSHLFIYTSDYYQGLIQKANLTNPTELVSSGEEIEIQHVCIDRNLPPCVLIQAYLSPNIAARTNGQVKLSVISLVELQIAGPDTLTQVGDGTLDMVNIFTGYVAGELPALEVQSLWGSASDWETSYLILTDLAEDIDRLMLEATDGSHVLNRNWFAGADQWFYSSKPLQAVEDYDGLKIRSNSASMSDFIVGMGGQPDFTSVAELYTSLNVGLVDVAVYGVLLAASAKLYEVTDYMAGPIVGFGYTNNVINKDVWNEIPEDLQQIIVEEGAKAELEGLRLAPFQNVAAVAINQQLGMQPVPFSEEILQHIQTVVVPQHIIPGWLRRLGYPERNQEAVRIFNEHVGAYIGLKVEADGSVARTEITKGPHAN